MPQLVPSITIRLSRKDGEFRTDVEEIENFSFSKENISLLQVTGASADQAQESFKAKVKKLQLGRKLPKSIGFTFILSVQDLSREISE